jgi:hypothetical protein
MIHRFPLHRAVTAICALLMACPDLPAFADDSTPRLPAASAASPPACDLTGSWRFTLGDLSLLQLPGTPAGTAIASHLTALGVGEGETPADGSPAGGVVTGRYQTAAGEGRIDGIVRGPRLDLKWFQPESFAPPDNAGDGYLEIAGDCDHLAGAFRFGFTGEPANPWTAERVATGAPAGDPELEAAHRRLDAGFDALEEYRAAMPRQGFDAAALAARLGPDLSAAFAYLRDRVGYQPYAGALRGVRGTLLAGAGNAADRSLLLAALLKQQGFAVRFATAVLSDADAASLLDAARPGDAAAVGPARLPATLLGAAGIEPARVEAGALQAAAARQAFLDSVGAEAAHQAPLVAAALGDAVIGGGDPRQSLREDVRDHVWVQVRDGDAWVDLDPTLPAAIPGQRLAEAAETYDALPERLWQSVQFVLTIERRDADGLVTEELGGWSVRVADVMDSGLPAFTLVNQPLDTGGDPGASWSLDELAQAFTAYGSDAVLAASQFQPALILSSGEVQLGKPFDLKGEILPDDPQIRAAQGVQTAVGGGFAGAAGALDSLFGDPEPAPPPASTLTAYWIDYRIVGPDGARSFRRTILDRIGPAARAAGGTDLAEDAIDDDAARLRLSTVNEILVTGAPPTGEYAAALSLDHFLANRAYLTGLADVAYGAVAADMSLLGKGSQYPNLLLVLRLLQQEMLTEAAEAAGVAAYQAAPNLVIQQRGLMRRDAGLVAHRTIDLLDVSAATAPDAVPAAAADFQRRYGLLMTALESGVVSEQQARDCPDCAPVPVVDTGAVMRQATADGVPLVLLRPEQPADVESLPLPGDFRAALAGELAAGNWVIVPAEPVSVAGEAVAAWWRINPGTGAILGIVDGQGQTLAEFTIKEKILLIWPGVFFGGLTTAQCTGVGGPISTPKAVGCIFCGLIAGLCIELAYLTQVWEIAGPTCGFYSAAISGAVACSATFL